LVSWGLFRMAPMLFKLLGKTGINVITRLMGLLMLSLGIEVIAAGVKGLFPTLIG
ncbi:MAG TPA: MarC family protein, partial [Shewanella frigidimarina]|nr:MarC family protein [Shewanella frigidimarina]